MKDLVLQSNYLLASINPGPTKIVTGNEVEGTIPRPGIAGSFLFPPRTGHDNLRSVRIIMFTTIKLVLLVFNV